jgi:dephospho-CoA kinase
MLEHLGAYTIDADALTHRAISKGAPGYAPVIENFGRFILDGSGEINRIKLGRVVFNDPEALKTLEAIVHPLVGQAVNLLTQRASQKVIVIEAIKLLEGNLSSACDTIWVVTAPEEVQKARLVQRRGLSSPEALQRIRAQAPQDVKLAAAKVVIRNTGSFMETWKQVVEAWKGISPVTDTMPVVIKKAAPGEFSVQRGRPRDSANIASLVTRLSGGAQSPSQDDIMASFGEEAFLLLMADSQLVGLAGWQVENLVARTTELYLDPEIPQEEALKTLITELEHASRDLQCEASLVFLPSQQVSQEAIWKKMGYVQRTPQSLGIQAWQEAAKESQPPNTLLLFKQLRQDRVLRPI